MRTGRPTKFEEGMTVKAKQYLTDFEKDEAVPTVEGLSLYLEIPRQKVYEYAKRSDDFRDTLEQIQGTQGKRLVTMGLLKKFDSSIVKLLLAKHGYKDESKVEHSDPATSDKIDKLLDAMSKGLNK